MARTVAGARPLSETFRSTRTKLRPDYNALISSGYELQTAENQRALAALGGETQGRQAETDYLEQYYSQVQQQQTEARSANEQRYQQMLGIADQDFARQGAGFQEMLGTIGQETGQRAADIRSQTEQQVSDYQQQQSRLGLSNVYQPSIVGGIRREGESNLNRLTDALLGRKLGVQQQIAQRGRGTRLGIMERRTDAYPDISGMSSLVGTIAAGRGATAASRGGGFSRIPAGANTSLSPEQYRGKYG